METFLAEVAQKLRAEHPKDLDKVTVVFNNRRSGLFLRRQFANMEGQPFFLPEIIGLDDLVADLGCLEIVPNEFLLFELFDIHRELEGAERKFETFEEFISFGDMMLSDFSEIDRYCVDAKQLFNNLHELKALGEWDIETGKLTPFQERYLHFYKSLYQYYEKLRERLLANKRAYSGMAYRYVAENIETLFQDKHAHPTYFIGFNAFSASEDKIIQHFIQEGFGILHTDGDAYYYDNPKHEAGYFLRKFHKLEEGYPSHFKEGVKKITITSCPESVIQCKYAGEIIAKQQQRNPDNAIEQTALVLADEGLLLPALNALPHEIKTANITMGYPFTNTATHALMLKLFSLHQRRCETKFYHQDILDLFADQNISNLHGISNIQSKLGTLMAQEHIIYSTAEELENITQSLNGNFESIAFLFTQKAPDAEEFLGIVRQLIQAIYTNDKSEDNIREREALAGLLQIIDYFQDLQKEYHHFDSLNSLLRIYERLSKHHSVAFYGEPLQGLQILGVLETRNLDFKRLIILSANENVLPAGKSENTLIPYHLKTAFGIPTFHEKDAVYAYNFYRLIQRAEEINILYSTESKKSNKGEPSRFILQLRRELAQAYPDNIEITEEVLSANNASLPLPSLNGHSKDATSLTQLKALSQKGFSPTALNQYRSCPLLFYYQYILNIRPKEQVSEGLEQNELGTVIHAVLQKIYSLDADHIVRKETLQQSLEDLDELLSQEMKSHFLHGRSHEGHNYYLESVAKSQITHYLKSEIDYLEKGHTIEIIGLEVPVEHTISVPLGDTETVVRIKGTADRIDKADEFVRIIDYKSGKVDPADLSVTQPAPPIDKVSDKWFQVMTYTWLYQKNNAKSLPFTAGIVPLNNFKTSFLTAEWDGEECISPSHLDTFEDMLRDLLTELLDPENSFTIKPNAKKCNYCPFQEVCNP